MIATSNLVDAMVNLLAADTATLGSATAMHLHLAKAPFTPSPTLTLGALTEATFTGSAAIHAGTGTQLVYVDPLSGFTVVEVKEPAGGWHWVCTVTPGTTETIYGVYLTDGTDAVLYGSQLLPTPVPISAAGQGFDFANTKFILIGIPFGVAQ